MKKLIFLVTCAFSGILYSQNNVDITGSYVTNFSPFKQAEKVKNFENKGYYNDFEEPIQDDERHNFEHLDKDKLDHSSPKNTEYPNQDDFNYAEQDDHFDTNEEQNFQDQSSLDVYENQESSLEGKELNDENYLDGYQTFQYEKERAEERLNGKENKYPEESFYKQDTDFPKETFYNKDLEHADKNLNEKKAENFEKKFTDEKIDGFDEKDISIGEKICGFLSIFAKTAGNVQLFISNMFISSKQVKEIDDFEDNDYYYDFEVDDNFLDYEDPLQYEQQNNIDFLDDDNFEISDQEDYFESNKEYSQDSSSFENYENQETDLAKKELYNENHFDKSVKESQTLQEKKQLAFTEEKLYEKDPEHREENVFNDNLDYSVETLDEKQLKHPKEGFHKKDQENFKENFYEQQLVDFADFKEEKSFSIGGKIRGFFSLLAETAKSVRVYASELIPGQISLKQAKEIKNFEIDDIFYDYDKPLQHEQQNNLEYPENDNLEYSDKINSELPDEKKFEYTDQDDYFETNEKKFQDRSTFDNYKNQERDLVQKEPNDENFLDASQTVKYEEELAFTEEKLYGKENEDPENTFYQQDPKFIEENFFNDDLDYPEKIFDEKDSENFEENFYNEELDDIEDFKEEEEFSHDEKQKGYLEMDLIKLAFILFNVVYIVINSKWATTRIARKKPEETPVEAQVKTSKLYRYLAYNE